MGTKANPGEFDCYAKALPDEPIFTITARDPEFYYFVNKWAEQRENAVMCGDRPFSDMRMVQEARALATYGRDWRRNNNGKWRQQRRPTIEELEKILQAPDKSVFLGPDGEVFIRDPIETT